MDNTHMISVQTEDFDVPAEYQWLRDNSPGSGAIVLFTGLVREFSEQENISSMTLEHYPGMTEAVLKEISEEASNRWPLEQIRIIHRVGTLQGRDQIVLVGVSSAHRAAAYEASQFIMDILKTKAPFWKKETIKSEEGKSGERWVDAKTSDDEKADRWNS